MKRAMTNGTVLPRYIFVAMVFATLLSCGGGGGDDPAPVTPTPPSPPTPPVGGTPTITRTVVMSGLSAPWDVAFAPDGAMLYTERCAGLSVRRSNGTTQRL